MTKISKQKNTINIFEKTYRQPMDYKQYDIRWSKKIYSSTGDTEQTMEASGCGPTACADVVATLIDRHVTPWTLAELSLQWRDRTANKGTKWTFFKHIYNYYEGFSKFIQSGDIAVMKDCLDAGGYAVCIMAPGYWTERGHCICAWKYDDTYIYCNDPSSHERNKQKEAEFKAQAKQYFCYYPY